MVFLRSVGRNGQQDRNVLTGIWPVSGFQVRHRAGWRAIPFFITPVLLASSVAGADPLQDYQQECDRVIGATVSGFDCDAGTVIPVTHPTDPAQPADESCDQPNRLNKQCDPGSRFQVITRTDDAYIVALCRKKGQNPGNGKYRDVAVIQHNRKNGATCFYQAL